jgi:hypothetical protein
MLVLKRKEGQWVEVTHSSGDVMRIRVCQIESGQPGHLNLAFDDSARNFQIERPERKERLAAQARASAPQEIWDSWDSKGDTQIQDPAQSTVRYLQGIAPDRLRKRVI